MEVSLTVKMRAAVFLSATTGSVTTNKTLAAARLRIEEVTPMLVRVRFGVLVSVLLSPPELDRFLLGCLIRLATEAPIHVRTIPPVTIAAIIAATVVITTARTIDTAKARELTVTAAVVKTRLGCFVRVVALVPVEVIDRDGFRIRLTMLVTAPVSNRAGALKRELDDGLETDNILVGFLCIDVTSPSEVERIFPICLIKLASEFPIPVVNCR